MNNDLTRHLAQARSAELRRAAEQFRERPTRARTRTSIQLRTLGRHDRDGLAELFARLSPTSRYRRFFTAKHSLSERELAYLSDVDDVDHVAVAAVDARDGSLVGVGRYVRQCGAPRTAEVSFAVADEFQGTGIGSALAAEIMRRACANGIATLTAATLAENGAASALARRLGFRRAGPGGPVVELTLELGCAAASAGAPPGA